MTEGERSHVTDESLSLARGLADRFALVAAEGVALLLRQSSKIQKRQNRGSAAYQRAQLKFLEPYGVSEKDVEVFDARGESGTGSRPRPIFEALIDRVIAKAVRVVVVAFADRFSRGDKALDRLYDGLAEVGGYVVVGGRIYDPSDPGHRMLLGLLDIIARFENTQQSLRHATAKMALAEILGLRLKLPRGLTWGCPSDPEFAEAMEHAGLSHLITPEALAKHETRAMDKTKRPIFVLPFPDRAVNEAIRITRECLVEGGSISDVLDLIRNSSEWPRKGHFLSSTPRCWSSKCAVHWERVIDRPDGKREFGHQTISNWISGSGVCGVYAWNPDWVNDASSVEGSIFSPVWTEGAFPGVFTVSEREEILERRSSKGWVRSDAHVPKSERGHLLDELRCGMEMPDARLCHRLMCPTIRIDRPAEFRYFSASCSIRGHTSSAPPTIDALVLEIVAHAYSKEQIGALLDDVELDRGRLAERTRVLGNELKRRGAEKDSFIELAGDAKLRGDDAVVSEFLEKLKGITDVIRRLDLEIKQLAEEGRRAQEMGEGDLLRLKELASDIPRVLDELKAHPVECRRLVSLLIRKVVQTRICDGLLWCEVEFPGGGSLGAPLVTRDYSANPFQLQGLANLIRAEGGERPKNLTELTELYWMSVAVCHRLSLESGPPKGVWAVLASDSDSAAPTSTQSLVDLATLMDIGVLDVERALAQGQLGASWVKDGQVFVDVGDEVLHREFPEFARSVVADALGLEEASLREALSLGRSMGLHRKRFSRRMVRAGFGHKDASGRCWVETSKATKGSECEISEIPPPHGKSSETGCWVPLAKAASQLGCQRRYLKRYALSCKPGYGRRGRESVYLWVDADLEARVEAEWLRRHSLPPND